MRSLHSHKLAGAAYGVIQLMHENPYALAIVEGNYPVAFQLGRVPLSRLLDTSKDTRFDMLPLFPHDCGSWSAGSTTSCMTFWHK